MGTDDVRSLHRTKLVVKDVGSGGTRGLHVRVIVVDGISGSFPGYNF